MAAVGNSDQYTWVFVCRIVTCVFDIVNVNQRYSFNFKLIQTKLCIISLNIFYIRFLKINQVEPFCYFHSMCNGSVRLTKVTCVWNSNMCIRNMCIHMYGVCARESAGLRVCVRMHVYV